MKTVVFIPDDLFKAEVRLARRTKKSPTQLFNYAIQEYVARHTPENATDTMDQVCAELKPPIDEFVSSAATRILDRSEW